MNLIKKNYITLKNIIEELGHDNYQYIEVRCKWIDLDGDCYDEFVGSCTYYKGVLRSLDGDSYSLDDMYVEYEERKKRDGEYHLIVWM